MTGPELQQTQQYEKGQYEKGHQIKDPQEQDPPGLQKEMTPQPISKELPDTSPHTCTTQFYQAAGKLRGRVALITGGDSGIGRAIAILYAMEGCDVAINYLDCEKEDAKVTKEEVERQGRKCLQLAGDLAGGESVCENLVKKTVEHFGKLDILVNNAAEQWERHSLDELTEDIVNHTFRVNFTSQILLSKYALRHMQCGSSIINCSSVNHFKGNPSLIDYTSSKAAIIAFTRSLALQVADRGIRVNAVAPGPIWTPLITSTLSGEHITKLGQNVPLRRLGQPAEVATSFVFLASNDASYFTGQVLHPNGGVITGS